MKRILVLVLFAAFLLSSACSVVDQKIVSEDKNISSPIETAAVSSPLLNEKEKKITDKDEYKMFGLSDLSFSGFNLGFSKCANPNFNTSLEDIENRFGKDHVDYSEQLRNPHSDMNALKIANYPFARFSFVEEYGKANLVGVFTYFDDGSKFNGIRGIHNGQLFDEVLLLFTNEKAIEECFLNPGKNISLYPNNKDKKYNARLSFDEDKVSALFSYQIDENLYACLIIESFNNVVYLMDIDIRENTFEF